LTADVEYADNMIEAAINHRKAAMACFMEIIKYQRADHFGMFDSNDVAARGHNLTNSPLFKSQSAHHQMLIAIRKDATRHFDAME
jgi:hypothetical protein